MRIGDAERESAIRALNDHYAAGRLALDEFEQRVGRASVGQTLPELGALFDDLPAPHPAFLAPPLPPLGSMPPGPPPTTTFGPPSGPHAFPAPPPYVGPPSGPHGFPTTGQYGPPPVQGHHPGAPWGLDPITGQPLSDKSKVVAGILQLFLGGFGVGRFYTGHTGMAVAQLLTCGGCGIWALVDAIILLVNGGTDSHGRRLRD
jgi:hypothetical protein